MAGAAEELARLGGPLWRTAEGAGTGIVEVASLTVLVRVEGREAGPSARPWGLLGPRERSGGRCNQGQRDLNPVSCGGFSAAHPPPQASWTLNFTEPLSNIKSLLCSPGAAACQESHLSLPAFPKGAVIRASSLVVKL